MKIGIIGAGISGLSIGQILKEYFDVEILEKENEIGGIAKTKIVNGITYHLVGGHCFNSKNKNVLNFVFNKILSKSEWHLVERKAKIFFKNHIIDYPIEFSIKQIAKFDEELAFNITKDFFSSKENINPKNLAEWFIQKFGETLAKEYLIPYNRKIWNQDPYEMDYTWVKDKLPIPNKKSFFLSLIRDIKDNMPHSFFFYPNSNNQQTFINALSLGLKIVKNYPVKHIEKVGNKYVINGEKIYDLIISTMPLNLIPFVIKETPLEVKKKSRLLKYNRVTNMLWETEPVENTWTYFPDKEIKFHRHIHIGNFFEPKNSRYTIAEVIGKHSYEDMLNYAKKLDYLKKPLDYNVSEHAYVVFDKNYRNTKNYIIKFLEDYGIYTLGRFGEWEYYNMDICIEKAMQLSEKIIKRYG